MITVRPRLMTTVVEDLPTSPRPLPVPPTNKESLPIHHCLHDHLSMPTPLRGLAILFLPTTALLPRKIHIFLPTASRRPPVMILSATTIVTEVGKENGTGKGTTDATTAIVIIPSHTATVTAIEIGSGNVIGTDIAVTGTGMTHMTYAAPLLRTMTAEKMVQSPTLRVAGAVLDRRRVG